MSVVNQRVNEVAKQLIGSVGLAMFYWSLEGRGKGVYTPTSLSATRCTNNTYMCRLQLLKGTSMFVIKTFSFHQIGHNTFCLHSCHSSFLWSTLILNTLINTT